MSERDDTVRVNPPEGPAGDRERTLAAPSFDERSVRTARVAVPLEHKKEGARGGGKLPWVVVALVAGMIGGLIGIWVLNRYQISTDGAPNISDAPARAAESTPATPAAAPDAQATNSSTLPDAAQPQTAGDLQGDAAASADATPEDSAPAGEAEAEELRGALSGWIDATNARDLDRQMDFYDSRVATFYLARDASRAAVRAEKANAFARATSVEVRAGQPQISLSRDGRTATMRFRKQYAIEGGGADRRGAVLQELRWRRTPAGWKIVGERDLRILD